MTRGVGGQSPANVQTHLKGISYPASKKDLISKARENDAPDDVLEVLQELPEEEYRGPQDVMKAYGEVR